MGRSYYVPRNAKGEGRILYIFTIKSLLTTLACGGIAAIVVFMINSVLNLSIFTIILSIVPFAAIGYGIGALKIPDVPIMGPLQKAGGENVMDILFRLATFGNKKRIYIYGMDRKLNDPKANAVKNPMNIIKRGKR